VTCAHTVEANNITEIIAMLFAKRDIAMTISCRTPKFRSEDSAIVADYIARSLQEVAEEPAKEQADLKGNRFLKPGKYPVTNPS